MIIKTSGNNNFRSGCSGMSHILCYAMLE